MKLPFQYLVEHVKPSAKEQPQDVALRIGGFLVKHSRHFATRVRWHHRYVGDTAGCRSIEFSFGLTRLCLPDSKVIALLYIRDVLRFGVLQSRSARSLDSFGTMRIAHGLGKRRDLQSDDLFRDAFPLPEPCARPEQLDAAIAAAAKELDEFRNRWLNPPEWTKTEVLEFPGSVDGPWARYMLIRRPGRRPHPNPSPAIARGSTCVRASAPCVGRGWCRKTPTVPRASKSGR